MYNAGLEVHEKKKYELCV